MMSAFKEKLVPTGNLRKPSSEIGAALSRARACGMFRVMTELISGRVRHLALVVALAWYSEDSLDKCAVGRLLEGCEPEEGANGRQAQAARPDAGAPLRLEISDSARRRISRRRRADSSDEAIRGATC